MNLFHKALAAIIRPLNILVNRDVDYLAGLPSSAGVPVSETSVLGIATVWGCINLLAGTIASLPVTVYRPDKQGIPQKDKDHPLSWILSESPNADQTSLDFWEFMQVALELRGNAYAKKDKIGERLVGLTPVDPGIVDVRRDETGTLRYRWSEDGVSYDLPASEMLHIRGFGGSPLGGLSPLSYCRSTFGLASAVDQAAANTFQNGLRPSGTLSFEKWLTDEQRTIAEKRLVERFAGAINAGRPMVLEGGSKWQAITMDPEDAQMLQSRSFSVEELCRIYGVPPFMVGHSEKVTAVSAGREQETLGFSKFSLRRRLKRNEKAMEKQLLSPADRAAGVFIRINIEGLLRGSSKERSDYYAVMLASGVMTINEVRALENLPPVPGGDIPRMQMQNVPITQATGTKPVAME